MKVKSKNVGDGMLKEITRVVVETDEENPITIAGITFNDVLMADGYRVRLTPSYDE